jgi:hypothetical protein
MGILESYGGGFNLLNPPTNNQPKGVIMTKLQETLATLSDYNKWRRYEEDDQPVPMPKAHDIGIAIDHAIEVLKTVQTFLTNRQKNNCSSACSPLVAIAEGV